MREPASADEVRLVPVDSWHESVVSAVGEGFAVLGLVTAVDEVGRSDEIRLIARLTRRGSAHGVQIQTLVPRDGAHLPTLGDVLAGAAWFEREVHDFFGVAFDGADMAPLLNHDETIRPLRKDVVLAARTVVAWPGAKEPGEQASAPSRRKMVPPGVPDAQVWGDRDADMPAPTAEELAAAIAGGRVRRRR